jgi:hypothetical protein
MNPIAGRIIDLDTARWLGLVAKLGSVTKAAKHRPGAVNDDHTATLLKSTAQAPAGKTAAARGHKDDRPPAKERNK